MLNSTIESIVIFLAGIFASEFFLLGILFLLNFILEAFDSLIDNLEFTFKKKK